jgi:aspartyl protease family protein
MREIVLFCVAIGLAAVFAPQFLTEVAKNRAVQRSTEQTASRVVKPRTQAAKARKSRVAQAARAEIRAGSNGHFLLDADVNYSKVRFVVDTGASYVALRESDARNAGIYLNSNDFRLPVSTANGTAYAAMVQLDMISVEGIDLERVSAIVMPDRLLNISLLGNSFLSRLNKFEVSNSRLVMEN